MIITKRIKGITMKTGKTALVKARMPFTIMNTPMKSMKNIEITTKKWIIMIKKIEKENSTILMASETAKMPAITIEIPITRAIMADTTTAIITTINTIKTRKKSNIKLKSNSLPTKKI